MVAKCGLRDMSHVEQTSPACLDLLFRVQAQCLSPQLFLGAPCGVRPLAPLLCPLHPAFPALPSPKVLTSSAPLLGTFLALLFLPPFLGSESLPWARSPHSPWERRWRSSPTHSHSPVLTPHARLLPPLQS